MSKIYGYKEKDIISLAEFLTLRKGKPLSETFEIYGETYGKAKGTVRNLYYALAKLSNTDKEFCDKYLGGSPLLVGKIESFSDEEEKTLVKSVLLGQMDGRSARSVIMQLSNDDGKLALRYQNKFRNALKNKPHLIAEIVKEIKDEGGDILNYKEQKIPTSIVPEKQMERLKSEINALVGKIALKTKKENDRLKERIIALEKENLRLSNLLYNDGKRLDAIRYFRPNGGQDALN